MMNLVRILQRASCQKVEYLMEVIIRYCHHQKYCLRAKCCSKRSQIMDLLLVHLQISSILRLGVVGLAGYQKDHLSLIGLDPIALSPSLMTDSRLHFQIMIRQVFKQLVDFLIQISFLLAFNLIFSFQKYSILVLFMLLN